MKKLIIKTAIITFVSVILGLVLIFTAISLVSPKTMSEFTYSLGMEESSLKYAVKAYDKSESLEDLEVVLIKSLATEDYQTLKKYSRVAIDRGDFPSLKIDDKETVFAYYVLSLVMTDDADAFTKTVEVYNDFYLTYEADNPVSVLLTFTADYDDDFISFANGLTVTPTLTLDINKVNDR